MNVKLDKIVSVVVNKPPTFVFAGLVYVVLVVILKWWMNPNVQSVLFLFGGIMGIYFLDIAELFTRLSPSPFRSIVFLLLFTITGFFVVSSSTGVVGRGLVLTLHLMLLLLQTGEWKTRGNLNSWYLMVADAVPERTQLILLVLFGLFLIINTYLFIR